MITRIILLCALSVASTAAADNQIVCPPDAASNAKLAAKEVRRYVYLRTGKLLQVT